MLPGPVWGVFYHPGLCLHNPGWTPPCGTRLWSTPPSPTPGRGLTNHWFQFAGRIIGTKWVHIAPISMIFGPDCVVFLRGSRIWSPKGPKGLKKAKKNHQKLFYLWREGGGAGGDLVFCYFLAFSSSVGPFGGQIRIPRKKNIQSGPKIIEIGAIWTYFVPIIRPAN